MNKAPLNGITIVSLEHAIGAPLCTRQLAELGARVIKIERRGTGDFARYLPGILCPALYQQSESLFL